MKKLFICAVFAISAMMMATPAMAFDAAEHVVQAPNGVGDLLIFPHYVALDGGWETKLTVTNTDDRRSVVAKLVVRSGGYSQELLDFLIYLSPADVWTGTLYYNATNGPSMRSTDDSCQSAPGIWASAATPLDQPLANTCSNDPYGDAIGYVEVIEIWSSDNDFQCSLGPINLGPIADIPVDKICIQEAYLGFFALTNDTAYNVLTGHYELSLTGAFVGGDLATVMRDYDQIDQELITAETRLGTGANNNLCEVEAALSKDPINMPFINNGGFALHWISFPTKLSNVTPDCTYIGNPGDGLACDSPSDVLDTQVFEPSQNYAVVFQPKYWDLTEHTPGSTGAIFSPFTTPPPDQLPYEVNLNITQDPFVGVNYTEGWFRYDFDANTTCSPLASIDDEIAYSGVPGIALAWIFNDNGVAIVPSSHTNGTVTYEDDIMPYYQYYNEAYNPNYYITVPAIVPGEFDY